MSLQLHKVVIAVALVLFACISTPCRDGFKVDEILARSKRCWVRCLDTSNVDQGHIAL